MGGEQNDHRKEFLLEMYRQTSSHLNRHILLSWQSIGVVGGALVVFVLGDKLELKPDVRLDFAIAVVILLCAWSMAHVFDANNWFERNLHIITNIERQFLLPSDLRDIHFYFEHHRRERSESWLIKHLKVQIWMTIGLWIMLLLFHLSVRIFVPTKEWIAITPYVATVICIVFCYRFAEDRKKDYEDLLRTSPGAKVKPVKEAQTRAP
jgi:uncharacterized membrane protein